MMKTATGHLADWNDVDDARANMAALAYRLADGDFEVFKQIMNAADSLSIRSEAYGYASAMDSANETIASLQPPF